MFFDSVSYDVHTICNMGYRNATIPGPLWMCTPLTFNAPLFEGISESEALGSVAPQLTRAMSRVTGILVTDPIHSPFEIVCTLPQEPDTDIVFLLI